MADRLGYDSIWAMDHSNVPQWKNAIVNDAWLLLAALGAVTRNVELGTCVTDAIRRHPSAIALSTITLDRITQGRGILGIGAGEAQNVVDFGIEFSKPVTKFKEQLEVIELLFDSDPEHRVNYSGEYYKLINACLQAKSIRNPRPPVYIELELRKHYSYVQNMATAGSRLATHLSSSPIMPTLLGITQRSVTGT